MISRTGSKAIHVSPLGLYIHIPFCEKKCPYCDFNTYAGLRRLFPQTIDALCQEIAYWGGKLTNPRLSTIFLGGGTPTILDHAQLEQLFNAIQQHFVLGDACEITCEANPGTVDRAKFETLQQLGVNRLSLGVQSFQEEELQFLGRIHSVADVYAAFEAARQVGLNNINLDFIFGLPQQPQPAWEATLAKAIALAPEHLSLYSLIVEPHTPLSHWVESGRVAEPDDDLAAQHYEYAMTQLAKAGYVQYEVSNWAKKLHPAGSTPGKSNERESSTAPVVVSDSVLSINQQIPTHASRHNLLYWRNQPYIGVGPGAHSYLPHLFEQKPEQQSAQQKTSVGTRWNNHKSVPGYIKRMQQDESIIEFSEDISVPLSMGETMMLGLRLIDEGVAFARFQQQYGCDMRTIFASQLAELKAAHLITYDQYHVCLTHRGLMLGNQVFAKFLPD